MPDTKGSTKVGLAVLVLERSYLGTEEHPPGTNRGKDIDRWNNAAGVALGSPYCASFQHAMWQGVDVELGHGVANADSYCPSLYAWGRALGYNVTRPFAGDIVLFDWAGDGVLDHVGMVERVLGLPIKGRGFMLQTIEANTSRGLTGSQSDGGGVYRRVRTVNSSTKFLRIPDSEAKP